MRASERQAFLQEIEESLELVRLDAEEQAEQERQANELRSIATQILSYFHLDQFAQQESTEEEIAA